MKPRFFTEDEFPLDILKERYYYNPNTGLFFKREKYKSIVMGTDHKEGYIAVSLLGGRFLLHRLIFFYMTGRWPKSTIDHIDTDKKNNKWNNLREATDTENKYNMRILPNKSVPFKGVSHAKGGKFRAVISHKNRQIHLGTFDTPEEAHKKYKETAILMRGEFARF